MTYRAILACAAAGLLSMASAAQAEVSILLESDTDGVGGAELFVASFATLDDVVSGNLGAIEASQLDIAPGFSVAGLAYDGQYRLLLERDVDDLFAADLLIGSFATMDALIAGAADSFQFSRVILDSAYSVAGFVYDGQYRLLYESEVDSIRGFEFVLESFANFDDLLNLRIGRVQTTQLDYREDFSVGGLAYDGQYHLLVESDLDTVSGREILLHSFATHDDLVNGFPVSNPQFSQLDLHEDFSVAAFLIGPAAVAPVPEPRSWAMLILGFGLAGAAMRSARGRVAGQVTA